MYERIKELAAGMEKHLSREPVHPVTDMRTVLEWCRNQSRDLLQNVPEEEEPDFTLRNFHWSGAMENVRKLQEKAANALAELLEPKGFFHHLRNAVMFRESERATLQDARDICQYSGSGVSPHIAAVLLREGIKSDWIFLVGRADPPQKEVAIAKIFGEGIELTSEELLTLAGTGVTAAKEHVIRRILELPYDRALYTQVLKRLFLVAPDLISRLGEAILDHTPSRDDLQLVIICCHGMVQERAVRLMMEEQPTLKELATLARRLPLHSPLKRQVVSYIADCATEGDIASESRHEHSGRGNATMGFHSKSIRAKLLSAIQEFQNERAMDLLLQTNPSCDELFFIYGALSPTHERKGAIGAELLDHAIQKNDAFILYQIFLLFPEYAERAAQAIIHSPQILGQLEDKAKSMAAIAERFPHLKEIAETIAPESSNLIGRMRADVELEEPDSRCSP